MPKTDGIAVANIKFMHLYKTKIVKSLMLSDIYFRVSAFINDITKNNIAVLLPKLNIKIYKKKLKRDYTVVELQLYFFFNWV